MRIYFTLSLIILLFAPPSLARDKTDLVVLVNGNQLNGEIKNLEHGLLALSTDSMGTVRIEWDDITIAESRYYFELELFDGTRYYGSIKGGTEPGQVLLVRGVDSKPLPLNEIVRVTPIENSFLERLNGSLSLGLNVTKSDDVSDQFNIAASATHRTRERAWNAKISAIATESDDTVSQRADLSVSMTRFRPNRWFTNYFAGFESSDELGLDLRSSIGFGMGRYLIQTNTVELELLAGLSGSQELLEGESDSVESIEGILEIGFSKYLYDHPNVDIDLSLKAFPSLTEKGRVRGQFDARIRRELIEDLFLDLTIYASYDNQPQSMEGETTDHGVVTSLGWSF